MAYSIWNSDFEGKPDGSDDPSLGDDEIRDFKTLARGILAKEHHLVPATDTAALQGWHNEGSAVAYYQADAPTQRPDESTSLDTSDDGRLWVDSDDGKLYVWTGAAWDALTPGTAIGDELASLTAAEVQQLQNIGSETISATRWGYIGAMDQGVATGSDVAFDSIDIAGGASSGGVSITDAAGLEVGCEATFGEGIHVDATASNKLFGSGGDVYWGNGNPAVSTKLN